VSDDVNAPNLPVAPSGPVALKAREADDFKGVGAICDLPKPFSIAAGAVIVVFSPSNPNQGTYS
jgi:hypothetical protein